MRNFSLLIALISMFFFVSCGTSTTDNKASNTSDKIVEASLKVLGNCGMCKSRIEKTAKAIDGVETAVWDKETNQLKITHREGIDIEAVHKAMADVGHDTETHKANDEVYNNLPGCCQYRSGNPHE